MPIITQEKRKETEITLLAVVAFTPPPPAGSIKELAETAFLVGFPGAFGMTGQAVEKSFRDIFIARFIREE